MPSQSARPGLRLRAASLVVLVALTRGMPPFSVGFEDHPKHPRDPNALPAYLEDVIEFAVNHGKDAHAPALRDNNRR